MNQTIGLDSSTTHVGWSPLDAGTAAPLCHGTVRFFPSTAAETAGNAQVACQAGRCFDIRPLPTQSFSTFTAEALASRCAAQCWPSSGKEEPVNTPSPSPTALCCDHRNSKLSSALRTENQRNGACTKMRKNHRRHVPVTLTFRFTVWFKAEACRASSSKSVLG